MKYNTPFVYNMWGFAYRFAMQLAEDYLILGYDLTGSAAANWLREISADARSMYCMGGEL